MSHYKGQIIKFATENSVTSGSNIRKPKVVYDFAVTQGL